MVSSIEIKSSDVDDEEEFEFKFYVINGKAINRTPLLIQKGQDIV